MKVRRIYYSYFTEPVVSFLKWKRGFRWLRFVPLGNYGPHTGEGNEKRFDIDEDCAILLWEWGLNHHLSHYFRPDIPYSKSVDDAHCDFFYPHDGRVSCGNHNFFTLALDPNARTIEVLGCHPNYMGKRNSGPEGPTIKARYEGEPEKPFVISSGLESTLTGGAVHKSIDLDVVHGYPCISRFANAQEQISVEDIQEGLAELMSRCDVVRLDIGGAYFEQMKDGRFERKKAKEMMRRACEAYRALLETALDFR